jgi:predicted ATP-grasp superfamily ATP-dependent carboligase
MNTGAWLPRRSAGRARRVIKTQDNRAGCGNNPRMPEPAKPLRVLVSEGSSTSAREAVTILGLAGHAIEVCDPSPWCLLRFSQLVRKFHRCPGLRDDPAGYLAFIEQLLAEGKFDVLLPTHEQGFLFARVQQRMASRAGLALPGFESYRAAHSKAGFSRLLDNLGLPQPPTRIVTSAQQLRDAIRFPAVVKTAVGTASRGIWFVRDANDLEAALQDLGGGAFADEVLVQDLIAGTTEKAQSVFCRGRMVGFHAYRQVMAGVGGGEAIKQSVRRPVVRALLETIGQALDWHGALSIDYIMPDDGGAPSLIDCNPRLVEPFNAYRSGVDLVFLLLRISLGEMPEALPEGREGVLTHLAVQALLGCAARGGTRRDIARECRRLLANSGHYAGSMEELTPVRRDGMSVIPLSITAALLLASPKSAIKLARGGFGAHLLDLKSIRTIEGESFGRER